MTFFEYWCTWGVCMAGAGAGVLLGYVWDKLRGR
jgi:hypothetical protein